MLADGCAFHACLPACLTDQQPPHGLPLFTSQSRYADSVVFAVVDVVAFPFVGVGTVYCIVDVSSGLHPKP